MGLQSQITDVDRMGELEQIQNVSDIQTVALLELLETVQTVETLQEIRDSVDANHYPNGNAGDEDGTTYPVTVDPAETIKELGVEPGEEIVAEITTTGGDTFPLPVTGPVIVDRWDVDSVTFSDPDATGARLIWWWAGE